MHKSCALEEGPRTVDRRARSGCRWRRAASGTGRAPQTGDRVQASAS